MPWVRRGGTEGKHVSVRQENRSPDGLCTSTSPGAPWALTIGRRARGADRIPGGRGRSPAPQAAAGHGRNAGASGPRGVVTERPRASRGVDEAQTGGRDDTGRCSLVVAVAGRWGGARSAGRVPYVVGGAVGSSAVAEAGLATPAATVVAMGDAEACGEPEPGGGVCGAAAGAAGGVFGGAVPGAGAAEVVAGGGDCGVRGVGGAADDPGAGGVLAGDHLGHRAAAGGGEAGRLLGHDLLRLGGAGDGVLPGLVALTMEQGP